MNVERSRGRLLETLTSKKFIDAISAGLGVVIVVLIAIWTGQVS